MAKQLMDEDVRQSAPKTAPKPTATARPPAWMGRMNTNPDEGYTGFQTPTSSAPTSRPAWGNMGGGMGQNMTGYTAANANAQNSNVGRPANVGYYEEAAAQQARRRAGLSPTSPMLGTSDVQYQISRGSAPSYQPQPTSSIPAWLRVTGGGQMPGGLSPQQRNEAEENLGSMTFEEALAIAQAGQNPNSWMGQNDPHHLMNPNIDFYPSTGPLMPWWMQPTQQEPTMTPTVTPSMMSSYGSGDGGGYTKRRKGFGSSYGGNWEGGGGGYGGEYTNPAWLENMGLYSLKWGG